MMGKRSNGAIIPLKRLPFLEGTDVGVVEEKEGEDGDAGVAGEKIPTPWSVLGRRC